VRKSHGLEQTLQALPERDGLSILDLGEVNQANVAFVTSLGHRLYSEDFLHSLDKVFGAGDPEVSQADVAKAREFLEETLQFPPDHFDAVLAWDSLEYLSRPLLAATMERLLRLLRPQGVMLAFFHSEAHARVVLHYGFHIVDSHSLQLTPRSQRPLLQVFNNRAIEKLFEPCRSVKFFLTRESLREVIVKR
jgi:hypothetical protein